MIPSLEEIEAAITQLSDDEARKLLNWLADYLDDDWDKQIKADACSGRLNQLIQTAEADIAANHIKPLDEVIHNS